MKVTVITQARSNSTRLPNKVLLKIQDKTLLQIHLERISRAKNVDEIIVASTVNKDDDKIEELVKSLGYTICRGSEGDVLDRFYQAVKSSKPDFIIRLTSDCPLIDPVLLDEMIVKAKERKLDYYANVLEERYPDGQDIEIFTFCALEKSWKEAKLKSEREHVTSYIRNNSSYLGGQLFNSDNYGLIENYNKVRLTVDEPNDLEVIKILIKKFGIDKDWKTYSDYYLNNDEIKRINGDIIRNEGYLKSLKKD